MKNALLFGGLAALSIVSAVVLSALGHPIPDFVTYIATAAVAALAGISIPSVAPAVGPAELLAAVQAHAAAAAVNPSPVYATPTATAPVAPAEGTVPAVAPGA